jgi:hypothetical protein
LVFLEFFTSNSLFLEHDLGHDSLLGQLSLCEQLAADCSLRLCLCQLRTSLFLLQSIIFANDVHEITDELLGNLFSRFMTVSDDLASLPFLESTFCPSFRRKSSKPGNSGKGISKFMAENGHIDLSSHASGGMGSTLCKLSKRAHPVWFLAVVDSSVDQLFARLLTPDRAVCFVCSCTFLGAF